MEMELRLCLEMGLRGLGLNCQLGAAVPSNQPPQCDEEREWDHDYREE